MTRSEVVADISQKEFQIAEKSRLEFLVATENSNAVQGRSDQKKASSQKTFLKEKEEFERLHVTEN
jgi:hypothetical protein